MINNDRRLYYSTSLILSNDKRKSAEALAKLLNKSGDTVLRILDAESIDRDELIAKAKQYFGTNKVSVIIDDTIIKKMHSEYIGGSCDNYDPVLKKTYRSICTIVAMLTDGKTAIPVVHELWVNKELCPEDYYQTKAQIAQGLIGRLKGEIEIEIVVMDGLYSTTGMIKWCNENNIPFEMRFHSNRVVSFDPNKPDVTVKISEYKELKLIGKKSCRTVKAVWYGEVVYITAVKRFKKDGSPFIVYQISNVKMSAPDHVLAYSHRWNIEKFFRTAKQHLGLADCQSRKKSLQEKHIYNVFLAYLILQLERKKYKLKSPEEALHRIKRKKNIPITLHLKRVDQIFCNSDGTYA